MIAAEEAILSSNVVICPIVPERLSIWGMDKMIEYFDALQSQHGNVPPWRFVVSRYMNNTVEGQNQIETIQNTYRDHFLRDNPGFLGLGGTELIGLPRSQTLVTRIARFSDNPDDYRSLESFYGEELTQQLRRIVRRIRGMAH
jgi:cellulose biosynthesis protein BcsQ